MAKKAAGAGNARESMESIDSLRVKLEKDYGKGSLISDAADTEVVWVSSGIPSLDYVLGQGFPRGRVIEVFGPESSGKTSLALHAISKYQKRGMKAAFIDAEYSYDGAWAEKTFGVNNSDLMLLHPDCGEDALGALETMVASDLFDIIVLDSVAALTPRAEIDGQMGDSHMGLHARLMSQALRKITNIIGKTKTTVIFINQLRMKIGVMFGNPETTTGGNALKFYASIRVDVRRKGGLTVKGDSSAEDRSTPIGVHQRIKCVKNKCSPPLRETELKLYYGKGYDVVGDIFDQAVQFGIIEKGGSWYSYDGAKLGQGEAQAIKALKGNKEILKPILAAVKSTIQGATV